MDHLIGTYLRPMLAALFVLAGITVLSQEAHCLGMTLEVAHTHAAYHAAHGEAHKSAGSHDTHNCDHERNASAKADWTITTSSTPTLQKTPFPHNLYHWTDTLAHVVSAQTRAAQTGTPPPTGIATPNNSDVLTVTGRLLI
mgnify:CR=1 FL=1|tara:strand:- start:18600 stop:19022 length:423 start_codon:yes stop_codon:yes gene_type:complete